MKNTETINWEMIANEADVKRTLEQHLSETASLSDVQAFGLQQGLECSDVVNGVVYCSALAPNELPFTRSKWLIKFHFVDAGLTSIEVTKGLVGP